MIGLRYTYIHTKWNIMWPWKEWDIAICSNMDGPRENIMLSEVSHMKVKVKSLSHVQLFVTPWTVAYQASLSMGFFRQEHWSGLPFPSPMHESESEVAQSCPTLSDPMDCSPPSSSVHGIFQARGLEWGAIAFSSIVY